MKVGMRKTLRVRVFQRHCLSKIPRPRVLSNARRKA